MGIIRDRENETSKNYETAMMEILPVLEEKVVSKEVNAENYWEVKQELLKRYGIDWKTPAELNPDVIK